MFGLLFIGFALCDTFSKMICIAIEQKDDNDSPCKDEINLNPTSSTFYEEYTSLRKNSRDINIIINDRRAITFDFNIQILSGQNVHFTAINDNSATINFLFKSSADYSACNFSFDSSIKSIFKSVNEEASSKLIIGNIIGSNTMFGTKDSSIELLYRTLDVPVNSLEFVSKLTQDKKGYTNLSLSKNDKLDISFAQPKTFVLNGVSKECSFVEGQPMKFTGSATNNEIHDTLKVTYPELKDMSRMPIIEYLKISELNFIGELWSPTDTNPLILLDKCVMIKVNSAHFPFTCISSKMTIHVQKSINIYGEIDSSDFNSYCDLFINSDSNQAIDVRFEKHIRAIMTIQSPIVNVELMNISSKVKNKDFPIYPAINEDKVSAIKIHNIYLENQINVFNFAFYVCVENILSDEDISQTNIYNGLEFIQLPKGFLPLRDFDLAILDISPSSQNGIPGFTKSNNCLDVFARIEGEYMKISAKVVKSAFETPCYICLRKDSTSRCYYSSIDADFTVYDVGAEDFTLEKAFKKGYKSYYILIESTYSQSSVRKVDFNQLSSSYKNLNITIIGSSQYVYFENNDISRIQNLTINGYNLYLTPSGDDQSLVINAQNITIHDAKFGSGTYSFNENVDVYISIDVYKLLTDVGETNVPKKLFLYKSSSSNLRPYTVEVAKQYWKIFYDTDSYTPKAEVNYGANFVKEMTFITSTDVKLKINKPSDPKAFNLKLQKDCVVSFLGNDWSTTTFDQNITIDHGSNKIYVVFSSPDQDKQITTIGDGSGVSYTVNYDVKSLCLYNDSATSTCKNSFTYPTKELLSTNITENIISITSMGINIGIDYFSSPISVDFSVLSKKEIEIKSYEYQNPVQLILNVDKGHELDRKFSKTKFNDLSVGLSSKPVEISFGELEFNSRTVFSNDWVDVPLVVNRLECKFEDLSKFKTIKVNDQLNISGTIPKDLVKTVTFAADSDANDLIVKLSENAHIEILDDKIMIEKITFEIKQSPNIDIWIQAETSNVDIDIECKATSSTKIPRMKFSFAKTKSSIEFSGTWPSLTDDNPIIYIEASEIVNLTINGEMPLYIYKTKLIVLHLNSPTCSILGPVELYKDYRDGEGIKIYAGIDENIDFTLTKGIRVMQYYDNNIFLIQLYSANIKMTVGPIEYLDSKKETQQLKLINTINPKAASSITLLHELPERLELSNTFIIRSTLVGKLDEDSIDLLKSDHTILKAKAQNMFFESISFSYLEDPSVEDRTHGFYNVMNCMQIDIIDKDSFREIIFLKKVMPSEIPFLIDFSEEKKNGEVQIRPVNQEELKDLPSKLPKKVNEIIFRIYDDMTNDKAFIDFNTIASTIGSAKISVISPDDPKTVFAKLPTNNALDIIINNVILTISETNSMIAKRINFSNIDFKDCKFKINKDEIQTLILDVDSLNDLTDKKLLNEFWNQLIIQSANIILFVKDGWQFKENDLKDVITIKPENFKNVSFETIYSFELRIGEPNISEIKGLELNAHPLKDNKVYATFGRNWNKITKLNGMKIKVGNANEVIAYSSSYPIPNVFDCDDNILSYWFETDSDGGFDLIEYKNGHVFTEQVNLNLEKLPEEFQVVKGETLIFQGESGVTFKHNIGRLETTSILIQENSKVVFNDVSVQNNLFLSQNSRAQGRFIYDRNTIVTLHWNLETPPYILYTNNSIYMPKKLELIYDPDDADLDLFREKLLTNSGIALMEGKFDCYTMTRKQVSYQSRYSYFSDGKDNVLALTCDRSANGDVLLLYSIKDIYENQESGNKNKLTVGGTVGVVIGCVVAVALIVSLAVYIHQRKKIDMLKNEIPVEKNSAYQSSAIDNETNSYTSRSETSVDEEF